MAEALREMFNQAFYERLAAGFKDLHPGFNTKKFLSEVTHGLDGMALNQRMRHTSLTLKKHLPEKLDEAVEIVCAVAPGFKGHYTSLLFPDFIGLYGKQNISLSLKALKHLTQFGSSEFAIREFLRLDPDRTLRQMYKWAEDDNYHVRRLASEGSRPRLPWSFNLEKIMKDPELTRPILEKLKSDEILYVKKSVANHLNDFSRVQPDWMLNLVNSWDRQNEHTAWIVKHASRTLIKRGDPASLAVFDFEKNVKISVSDINFSKTKLKLGDNLAFSFSVSSLKSSSQKLVIDYKIHYRKKSGELLPKVFKLKELSLPAKASVLISKSHAFKDFSTRKHYSGKHVIEIMVNGKSYAVKDFTLSV